MLGFFTDSFTAKNAVSFATLNTTVNTLFTIMVQHQMFAGLTEQQLVEEEQKFRNAVVENVSDTTGKPFEIFYEPSNVRLLVKTAVSHHEAFIGNIKAIPYKSEDSGGDCEALNSDFVEALWEVPVKY